ncbi:hypothetical protein FA95DRAFT_1487183 [Auriscalpium vulgare]|uniref:Uncharacterized protein n=1 Tax=Auriscalpium vulgare TaxID=40419 RepID=A0ACB8S242_9AGAM|nr:hypothetical protein FA95DRAFT_1487183 [Auriscalpium vulgare]
MGWFGNRKEPPAAASRQDRTRCWEARDAYFACLDASGVVVAGSEGSRCAGQNKAYQENCARSWIDYFNKRRVLAEQQKPILAQAAMQAEEAKRRSS